MMRTLVVASVSLVALAAVCLIGWRPVQEAWRRQNMPKWRTAEVVQGDIVAVVNSTGTVKPVLQVSVGSFVSGPILELYCEFNQEVKKDELLAKIDPRIYQAQVDSAEANLKTREAEVYRVDAQLHQARRDEQRATDLAKEDPDFIALAEIDKVTYGRMALEAQLKLAKAAVDQARSQLQQAEANRDYCQIRSPVDGIVINRKIDPGQTLAAQFQTPELFIVAPDMRKKMHVHASVDEADIGLITEAKARKLPVSFTVDAYPDDLFVGVVEEIRLSSTTTQNVVTYPVIVAAPNPDLKLLPGMTPSLSFEVDRREKVAKIPNSALRFFPSPQHVRPADKPLVEGKVLEDEDEQPTEGNLSAADRAAARRARSRRHVWVVENYQLRAVEVVTGLADSKHTELVSGDLKVGDKLVIGIQPAMNGWGG